MNPLGITDPEEEPATLDDVCGLLVDVRDELRELNGKCPECGAPHEADE
jgi:hypothetical protein